jgi:Ssp1 endopeptidase immunity protein Rap1a
MNRLTIVTALAVTMLAAPGTWGIILTGNDIEPACEMPQDNQTITICSMYITGVIDAFYFASIIAHPSHEETATFIGQTRICLGGTTRLQQTAVVKKVAESPSRGVAPAGSSPHNESSSRSLPLQGHSMNRTTVTITGG